MSIPPSASVTYRLPIITSVACAKALTGFGVDHDALSVSPKMIELQLVSFGMQNIHCIGREAVFDENLIGKPLMMKPWCVDGLLNIEGEIDDANQDVGDGGDDGGPTGGAENEEELAILEDDGWRHGRERAFAGVDRVGRSLDESVGVGNALFGGEVVHFVVEQEAQSVGGDAGAEVVVEGGGNGYCVAFGIDDGIVRRIVWFANGCGSQLGVALQFAERRAFQVFAGAGVVEVDGVAPGGSVFLIDELGHRNFRVVGIAEEIGTIVKGAAKGFGFEVNGGGRAVAEFREVVAFEDVEDFDEGDSTGGWRRRADDVVATIGAANGLALFDFVGG